MGQECGDSWPLCSRGPSLSSLGDGVNDDGTKNMFSHTCFPPPPQSLPNDRMTPLALSFHADCRLFSGTPAVEIALCRPIGSLLNCGISGRGQERATWGAVTPPPPALITRHWDSCCWVSTFCSEVQNRWGTGFQGGQEGARNQASPHNTRHTAQN